MCDIVCKYFCNSTLVCMIQEQGCVHERECVCVCVSERENGCVCVSEREGRVFVSVCVSSRFGP